MALNLEMDNPKRRQVPGDRRRLQATVAVQPPQVLGQVIRRRLLDAADTLLAEIPDQVAQVAPVRVERRG